MSRKINDGLTKNQRYYRSHKEQNAPRQRVWRADHPENRAKENARSRAYYAAHRDELLAKASARAKKMRAERKGTAAWRLTLRMQKAKRRALLAQVPNTLTAAEWLALCESFGFRCAYCGALASELSFPLEQDHVIPLSKLGPHTRENVVPACKPCNSAKRDR